MAFGGNPLPNKVMNRVTKKCMEQIIPVFTHYAQLGTVKKPSLNQLRISPLLNLQ